MAFGTDGGSPAPLTEADRERLAAFRSATSLADLVTLTGAESEHRAYFDAKAEWFDLRGRELAGERREVVPDGVTDGGTDAAGATGDSPDTAVEPGDGAATGSDPADAPATGSDPADAPADIPGTPVEIDGVEFWVHGITHAGTDAEREFLRERVRALGDRGAWTYCEQGIREMYFEDFPAVCAMDDQRWAMDRCRNLDVESHLAGLGPEFEGVVEGVGDAASQFREAVFSLVDAGSDVYGEEFERALGDLATTFLTSHADVATGSDFESYRLSRAAAEDPRRLVDLQTYYEKRFLPQPIEREWLARHDREVELFTHARNERMADYAVYHHDTAPEVHLIVGAAHAPGVRYYLECHRDGDRNTAGFEVV